MNTCHTRKLNCPNSYRTIEMPVFSSVLKVFRDADCS